MARIEGESISLSDMTKALRAEIDRMRAELEIAGTPALLSLEKAEVELTFVAERSDTESAGLELKVLGFGASFGGEDGISDAVTQKLKLTLVPVGELPGVAGKRKDA